MKLLAVFKKNEANLYFFFRMISKIYFEWKRVQNSAYSMLPYGAMMMGDQVYLYIHMCGWLDYRDGRVLPFNLYIFTDFDIATIQKNKYYFQR